MSISSRAIEVGRLADLSYSEEYRGAIFVRKQVLSRDWWTEPRWNLSCRSTEAGVSYHEWRGWFVHAHSNICHHHGSTSSELHGDYLCGIHPGIYACIDTCCDPARARRLYAVFTGWVVFNFLIGRVQLLDRLGSILLRTRILSMLEGDSWENTVLKRPRHIEIRPSSTNDDSYPFYATNVDRQYGYGWKPLAMALKVLDEKKMRYLSGSYYFVVSDRFFILHQLLRSASLSSAKKSSFWNIFIWSSVSSQPDPWSSTLS